MTAMFQLSLNEWNIPLGGISIGLEKLKAYMNIIKPSQT